MVSHPHQPASATTRFVAVLFVVAILLWTVPVAATGPSATPPDQTPHGIEAVYNNSGVTATTGGKGVDVAVLDTGVDVDHPDLARRVARCRDYTVSPVRNGSCHDDSGHGTHVAGTILADGGPNGTGLYGIAPSADLYAFKTCSAAGDCSADAVAAAIRDAVHTGAEIVVLSLGGERAPHVQSVLDYANRRGVLVVAAAGNGGPALGSIAYPASDPLVVGVGAVGQVAPGTGPDAYAVTDFSARGVDASTFAQRRGYLEFVGPGVDVVSAWPGGGYDSLSGTSAAAPHVAGLAAKLWPLVEDDDGDGHRNDDVRDLLQRRATGFDITAGEHAGPGYDSASGFGLPTVARPRATFETPAAVPTVGEPVSFNATNSSAPDSEIVAYAWSFGDGGTATGPVVSHTFDRPGRLPVELRVRDADGAEAIAIRTIRVNAPPTAAFEQAPTVPLVGEPVTFDASTSTDPDGGIEAYAWSFDGGGTETGRTVTRSFGSPGGRSVELRVTDGDGVTTSVIREFVVNDHPSVTLSVPTTAVAGELVRLEATVTNEIGATTVTWTFEDGTAVTGTTVTQRFDVRRGRVVVVVADEYGARTTVEARIQVRPAGTSSPVRSSSRSPGLGQTVPPSGQPGFGFLPVVLALVAVLVLAVSRWVRRV